MPYFKYESKKVFYREKGSGDLLIIIPGNTASSAAHEGEINYFSENYHVVSLDILGTGLSDRLNKWSNEWWKDAAKQVNQLIKHLDCNEAILMGTSGGAVIALLFAIFYPNRVKSIIADSFVDKFTNQMLEKNIIKDRNENIDEKSKFWKYLHGNDWEEVINKDTELMFEFSKSGGDWFKGKLGEIQCPVLLTASRKDLILPNIEYKICEIAKEIEMSKVFLNDKGSHPLMWSESKCFREVTDLFLKNL